MAEVRKPRKVVDWDAVETHYRAGIRSLADIGAEFGVSDAGIIKRAKRDGWTRNLLAKIQAKADAKVSAATVSAEVSAEAKLTEKLTIEVEANVQARVRLAHRADVGKARTLAMSLLAELEHQTGNQDLYQQLAELLIDPEDDSSEAAKKRARDRMEAFQRAMSLGGRTKTMKDLADTLKTLVALEREAYGIDKSTPDDDEGSGKVREPDKNMARRFALAIYLGMQAANDANKAADAA